MESKSTKMDQAMRDTGKMINMKVKVSSKKSMDLSTKGNGRMGKRMGWEK